ncbi:hypothetical protein KKA24_03070 [Patescibacteria group bacterium]|nr:hypothetical protein [Patescibacteria group bacterium]
MSTWLDSIETEAEKMVIGISLAPSLEVRSEDNEAGEVDDELKKFWSLAQLWEKEAKEKALQAEYEANIEVRELLIEQASCLKQRHDALMEIFWISVRDTFDLWEKQMIGIRKGWIIVWKSEKGCSIFEVLDDLFRRGHEQE